MQADYSIIGDILAKYPDLTQEEKLILDEWLSDEKNQKRFEAATDNQTRLYNLERYLKIKEEADQGKEKYYALIAQSTAIKKISRWNNWKTYMAAASVILVIGLIGYKWLGRKEQRAVTETPTIAKTSDIKPGQFKARLTLDNGTVVILDSAANGKLAQQGNTAVVNKDGQLIYQVQGEETKVLYNTLSTTKGETYATVLSDGTKVWLNAQSSIRYPVAFTGDIRQVEITGEAYFEVAKSVALLANGEKARRPFVVNAPGLEVEVLGTHFNINSYSDEDAIKTTLLEGRVKVRSKSNNSMAILQPGEQAALSSGAGQGNIVVKKDVDVDEAVAWKDGYFEFNGANLQTVMKQLIRWYDVDVVYQGQLPERKFLGEILRSNSLSQVLETLEKNGVHFKIAGKKIIVSP